MPAKLTPIVAVPGNHDYWISGGPIGQEKDQFGYGFMQMYGQDTEASFLNGTQPYDFSVDPHPGQTDTLPKQENFVFSHQIGDVAVLGWTGASTWTDFEEYAVKFCDWVGNATGVNTALLLGHWNVDTLGCETLATPDVYAKVKVMPGCANKLTLYIDGHEHCNHPSTIEGQADVGFTIGANGMSAPCPTPPQFGFIVLESDPDANGGPNVRVDYFEIVVGDTDNWEAMYGCFNSTSSFDTCRTSHSWPWRKIPGQDAASVSV